MKWTKAHSKNAIVAKARRRLARQLHDVAAGKTSKPRCKAKWVLHLVDAEHGDSMTMKLYRLPWPGRYVNAEMREFSAASVAKIVKDLLTNAP